jgi:hypothetical protein
VAISNSLNAGGMPSSRPLRPSGSNPAAQPDGGWTAEAANEFGGRKITVIVDRNGNVSKRPPPSESVR